ncbi:SusC/RagA family TonB-linked outer membrane protein [Pelobium manganitolerans]|nr:SusC/RagA family TonB-linked outer membrane protein [Pelobium manganitolerans]
MMMAKRITNFLCLAICFVLCAGQALAQTQPVVTVTGKVTDRGDKLPIPGASVSVLDKDNRTVSAAVTDISGNFAVKVKDKEYRITVSFIGYKTSRPVVVGDRTTLNITLESDVNALNEVVVKGEATVDNGTGLPISKIRNTSAISSINAREMQEMPSASIDQALQGRLPGVDIATVSGDPGSGMQIRIRGTASLNGSNDPLVVVDGMPYEVTIPDDFNFATSDDNAYGQLLNIAPSDISEISVLKDAAATAVWGSRAANGVLVITTKRGAMGPPTISYNFKGSVSPETKPIPILNGDQYTTLLLEEFYNAGRLFSTTENAKQFQYDPNDTYTYYNFSRNSDWTDAVVRTGFYHDHSLQISGGGEKARYLTSIGYLGQKGNQVGTDLGRITTRVNLDYNVSERIKFQSDVSYSHVDNNQPYSNKIRDVAYQKMPNQSVYEYDEYGNLTGNLFTPASTAQGTYAGTYNPLALASRAVNHQLGDNLNTRFNLRYTLVPKLLTLSSNLNFYVNNNKTKTFLPQNATGRPFTESVVNSASDADIDQFGLTTKTDLFITPDWGENHQFTGGLSFQSYDGRYTIQGLQASNTASSYLQDPSIPGRTNSGGSARSTVTQSRSIGLLAQANYFLMKRYTFAASVRMDGNSKFGPANRYGYFPTLSAAWRMGEEKFIKDNFKFVDEFKVRASWGQSGNAPKNDYSYFNTYTTYNYSYLGETGVSSSNLELSDLKWETNTQMNLGIDVELLEHRLRMGADFYKRRTTDLFFSGLQVANYNGFNSLTLNAGTMDNDGWEASFGYTALRNKTWTVDLNFNIAHNQNVIREISRLYKRESAKGITRNKTYYSFLQENNPFGSFYGWRATGIYANEAATVAKDRSGNPILSPDGEEVYMRFGYPTVDYQFQPGDVMYDDINHDGVIDYKDIVYLGNFNPKLTGGFGASINYKSRLKFTMYFTFRQGIDVINGTKMNTTDMISYNNQSTAVLRRWRNEGDVTDMPRAVYGIGYNSLGSSRYVEDASFLRLRTTTVRYEFADKFVKKIGLKSLSSYVTLDNLLTFTNYTGQDPDVSVRLTNAFSTLVDYSRTPPSKTITLGISTRF